MLQGRKSKYRNSNAICENSCTVCSAFSRRMWEMYGNKQTLTYEPWPKFNPAMLEEDSVQYPVSFNGKKRFELELPKTMSKEEVEAAVLSDERSAKWLVDGKAK